MADCPSAKRQLDSCFRHRVRILRGTLAVAVTAASLQSPAQTACTGLCLQQVSCGANSTTSVTGTVYAPNGIDPIPNVTVYVPNAAVAAFPAGVQCPVPGEAPSGSPLVGATTAADGTFTLNNMPVGTNIPLVIVSGKWRRQVTIPNVTACTNTPVTADLTHFPRNQSEGDIPQFAIATGRVDSVECVLRKVGIADSEFTNPTDTGRIHLYEGQGTTTTRGVTTSTGGAVINSSTPSQTTLMGDPTQLAKYDVVMLPCQGTGNGQGTDSNQNAAFLQYVNAGGRAYANHWSYEWLAGNASLTGAATFTGTTGSVNGTPTATVNQGFSSGSTLAQWLQLVGATTTLGQVSLTNVFDIVTGTAGTTQPYLNLNTDNAVIQFTFNTPIGATSQCGKVLYNGYHVEVPTSQTSALPFPSECAGSTTTLSPQDKLLEYSLFDLTSSGGTPTLTPATLDFGNEPVGFQTASKAFTWTNNSVFPVSITSANITGDFLITGQNCQNVAAGASCQINIAFAPTVIGAATGTLTVASPSATLNSTVTGNGVAALSVSTTTLSFPNTDVGATATNSFTVTNNAPGAVPLSSLSVSGDYSLINGCGASVASGATCTVQVIFKPTTTGSRTGAVTAAGLSVALVGTGIDFSLAFNPSSGTVVAGNGISTSLAVLPIAGFSSNVTMGCTTTAPASTCVLSTSSMVPSAGTAPAVTITTTSKYTIIGYGGLGLGFLGLFGMTLCATGFTSARRAASRVLLALATVALIAGATGCTGKAPGQNATYTPPGTYTYTVSATDGFLVHTATYYLTVTATR